VSTQVRKGRRNGHSRDAKGMRRKIPGYVPIVGKKANQEPSLPQKGGVGIQDSSERPRLKKSNPAATGMEGREGEPLISSQGRDGTSQTRRAEQ